MTDFVRIRFAKEKWPFVSGEEATVTRRTGAWFVQGGFAIQITTRPIEVDDTLPPMKAPRAAKKLTTRGK